MFKLFKNNKKKCSFSNNKKYIDNKISVISTHISKSIVFPVVKIMYRGNTIVFRYNFYDYEIYVNSRYPVTIPQIFSSANDYFYYQGFPNEYKTNQRYEKNKKEFIAKIDNDYDFYAFVCMLKNNFDQQPSQHGENYIPYIKYHQRKCGQAKITDDYIKETFGNDYSVLWDNHSHYAINNKTKQCFYIFKKEKRLVNIHDYYKEYLQDKHII